MEFSASEWKSKGRAAAQAEAAPLELPSGMVIMARRPDAIQVAMWGQMPLGLAAAVQGERSTPSTADMLAAIALSRDVLAYCCVSPRISLTPKGEDEIHPKDVDSNDMLFILRWARRGEEADSLRTFRPERQVASPGSDSTAVRSEAVSDVGDRGPGGGVGSGPGCVDGTADQRA
jgi:hypothetical protein